MMYHLKKRGKNRYRGPRFYLGGNFSKWIMALLALCAVIALSLFLISNLGTIMDMLRGDAIDVADPPPSEEQPVKEPEENKEPEPEPEPAELTVGAIYVERGALLSQERLSSLIELAQSGEINAFVIDAKDSTGALLYKSSLKVPFLDRVNDADTPDIAPVVERLKEEGIYLIARVCAFYDNIAPRRASAMAVKTKGVPWLDYDYHSWLNPYSPEAWDYIAAISEELSQMGFDEIMLYNTGFPTVGKLNVIDYGQSDSNEKRAAAVTTFVEKVKATVGDDTKVSVELSSLDSIGQGKGASGVSMADLSQVCDIICPDLRPSLFPKDTHIGETRIQNPAADFELLVEKGVLYAKDGAPEVKIRPWLQSYAPLEGRLREQIEAAKSAGSDGFMLRNDQSQYDSGSLLGG